MVLQSDCTAAGDRCPCGGRRRPAPRSPRGRRCVRRCGARCWPNVSRRRSPCRAPVLRGGPASSDFSRQYRWIEPVRLGRHQSKRTHLNLSVGKVIAASTNKLRFFSAALHCGARSCWQRASALRLAVRPAALRGAIHSSSPRYQPARPALRTPAYRSNDYCAA